MNITTQTLVSDIVAENYTTAEIFKKHNIDFCCNGNRSIDVVCTAQSIDSTELIKQLNETFNLKKDAHDYQSWDLSFLSDYIYNTHHKYVERKIPEIKSYLDKICQVHGNQHPELHDINALFVESANDLTTHMKKEELILFPYFKKLSDSNTNESQPVSRQFQTVESPIAMMHKEHDDEGERFRKIEALSNNYVPPEHACNTYKVTFAMLKEFQEDLHKHIHLENNILFKKAIAKEQSLQA